MPINKALEGSMQKDSYQPSINWLYVGFIAVAGTAALLLIGGILTWQVFGQWSQGLPITGGWNWPLVIFIDLACAAGIAALYRNIYCNAHTIMNRNGLTQPTQFGRVRTILWSEVTKVEVFGGVGYHVFARKQKIVITPYASQPRSAGRLRRYEL